MFFAWPVIEVLRQALNPLHTSQIKNRQAVRTNRHAWSMFPTLLNRIDCFRGSVSIVGIQNQNPYHPPSPVMCHSFHTSKMTGTHQEQLLDHLRFLLFFIELNMLLFIMISRHRRQQNPAQAQPASSPPPPPRRRGKPQNPWVIPWILQREERGCYRTLLDELITTDIPGYRNYRTSIFDLIEKTITLPISGSQSPTSGSHWKSGSNWQLH